MPRTAVCSPNCQSTPTQAPTIRAPAGADVSFHAYQLPMAIGAALLIFVVVLWWQHSCLARGTDGAVMGSRPVNGVLGGYPDTMDETDDRRIGDEPTVPGVGGPGAEVSSADGQRGLRLHAGIATVAVVLCAFVAWVFIGLGAWPLAVVFGVVGLASLGALGWALDRRRRGARLREVRAGVGDTPDAAAGHSHHRA